MSHATSEEIHDHAYGFRLSEHVSGCADCRRMADAVTAERETLRDVLEENAPSAPPELLRRLETVRPTRGRFGPAALAAAAVLLAALAWILLHGGIRIDSAVPAAPPTQEAEIDRLIKEVRSTSGRRRAIAEVALTAYGAAAVDPLIKAGAAPSLIDECRGLTIGDQQVIRKMKATRVTVDLRDASLVRVADFLREASGVNLHITEFENPDGYQVTLRETASVYECLERLKPSGVRFMVKDGVVVLHHREAPNPTSRAPVRLAPMIGPAKKLAARLTSGAAKDRSDAAAELRNLGFSVEPVLWELLDSTDAGAQGVADELLRALYLRPVSATTPNADDPAVIRILETWKDDVEFTSTSLTDILANLSGRSGLSILIDPGSEFSNQPITIKCKALALKNVLKLLLSQYHLDYARGDGCVILSAPGRVRSMRPPGPLWLAPETAKDVQNLLADVVSPDAARREKARKSLKEAGADALDWLSHAADVSGAAEAATYRELHRDLAESLKIWFMDRPSGVDLQKLTDAQKAVLAKPMAAGQKGLEGLPVVVKSAGEVRVTCAATPGMTVGAFLKSIARIQGLDIYMAGNEVVIDTAANVRKAVEK